MAFLDSYIEKLYGSSITWSLFWELNMSRRVLLWVDLRSEKLNVAFFLRKEVQAMNAIHRTALSPPDVLADIVIHAPVAIVCLVPEYGDECPIRELAGEIPVYTYATFVSYEDRKPDPRHALTIEHLIALLAKDLRNNP